MQKIVIVQEIQLPQPEVTGKIVAKDELNYKVWQVNVPRRGKTGRKNSVYAAKNRKLNGGMVSSNKATLRVSTASIAETLGYECCSRQCCSRMTLAEVKSERVDYYVKCTSEIGRLHFLVAKFKASRSDANNTFNYSFMGKAVCRRAYFFGVLGISRDKITNAMRTYWRYIMISALFQHTVSANLLKAICQLTILIQL